jgi:predicted N-formylglutamate amidohydrolase
VTYSSHAAFADETGIFERAAATVLQGSDPGWLVVCDHASNYIPPALSQLGVADADLERHIAWDIGADSIARRLARRLSATCVLANYSRLLIDCNRYPDAPSAVPAISDGTEIPGNTGLSAVQRQARVQGIFRPYHATVDAALGACLTDCAAPVFISVHTCSPSMNEVWRPWHVGIGWTRDTRTATPLLEALRLQEGIEVGDNEPYDLDIDYDFTTPQHAMTRGLPHIQVEFRQDLVRTREQAESWADRFFEALMEAKRDDWQVPVSHLNDEDGLRGALHY